MSDTNVLQFSLRERAWLSTKKFEPKTTNEPGQLLRVTCDPIGAVIQADTSVHHDSRRYSAPLALTLARFRDFKYIGTKISLVPAASTGQIDPAHISLAAGVNNYMHPRDVGNMIHWRRWIGGTIRVPTVSPSGELVAGKKTYSEFDAYDLDAAWLSDTRFNHSLVSDGFTLFVKPLRANLETSGASTVSIFGYYNIDNGSGKPAVTTGGQMNDAGYLAVTPGDVKPDSWVPNPFAGFIYHHQTQDETGDEEHSYVTSYNRTFPWFADYPDLSKLTTPPDVDYIYNAVRMRFMAPICILRLPDAYGSVYYWTLYMRHYFAVRRPYITNGTYTATSIRRFLPEPVFPDSGVRLLQAQEDDEDVYRVTQMIGPDPYAAGDGAAALQMDNADFASIWSMDVGDEGEVPDDDDLILPDDEQEPEQVPDEKKPEEPKKKHPAEATYVDEVNHGE